MVCPYCGAPLDNGAKFCGRCGKKVAVSAQSVVQRPTAAPVPNQTAVPAVQQQSAYEPPFQTQTPQKPKKKHGKLIAILLVVVLLLVLAGVGLFFLLGRNDSGKNAYVVLQDGRYEMITSLSKGELTEIASTKSDADDLGYNAVQFSEDGKYLYYVSKVGSDGCGTLCRAEYGKLKAGSAKNDKYITMIAANVDQWWFQPTANGVVYKNADDNLYYYNGSESVQICKNIWNFYTNEQNPEQVLIRKKGDEDSHDSLYWVDLKKPAEASKLADEMDYLYQFSDFAHILYGVEDENGKEVLYMVDTSGNAQKIAENIEGGTYGGIQSPSYYLADSGTHLSAYDFVNDPDPTQAQPSVDDYAVPNYYYYWFHDYQDVTYCEEIVASCTHNVSFFGDYTSIEAMQDSSNAAVAAACKSFVNKYASQEDRDGYFVVTNDVVADLNAIAQAAGQNGDTAWHELATGRDRGGSTYDYNAYDAAQELYELRQQLKSEENELPVYTLYRFDKGSAAAIAENLLFAVTDQPVIFGMDTNAFKQKPDLTDLVEDGEDLLDYADMMDYNAAHFYDTESGKLYGITENAFQNFIKVYENDNYQMVIAGGRFFLNDVTDNTLWAAPIENDTIGSFEMLSDDAHYAGKSGSTIYYAADFTDGRERTSLYAYANGSSRRIAEDIVSDYVYLYEDGQFLVKTDEEEIALIGKDGSRTVIADDVTLARRVDEDNLFYVSDGDLYFYNGKERRRIATDVEMMWTRSRVTSQIMFLS